MSLAEKVARAQLDEERKIALELGLVLSSPSTGPASTAWDTISPTVKEIRLRVARVAIREVIVAERAKKPLTKRDVIDGIMAENRKVKP